MTRMADDFERADRERDLRKHDIVRRSAGKFCSRCGIDAGSYRCPHIHCPLRADPLRIEPFPKPADDRAGNDLLLVALIVFGLLGSVLIALGVLVNHAAHHQSGISFRFAIPHCRFVSQEADCTIKKLNDAANQ